MGYLMDILIGAASRVVTGELAAHVEPVARWIINKAADGLPACHRERFREEWIAHLDETPGSFRKLLHAIGCRLAASTLANLPALPTGGTAQSDEIERTYRRFLEIVREIQPDAVLSADDLCLFRVLAGLTPEQFRGFAHALVASITSLKPDETLTVRVETSRRPKQAGRG